MKPKLSILYLEDDAADAELVRLALRRLDLSVELKIARSRDEYIAALQASSFDLILSDNKIPGFDGISALCLARKEAVGVPFIFLTGNGGREKLQNAGATDCLSKSELHNIGPVILRALEASRVKSAATKPDAYLHAMERLVAVVQELSLARDLNQIMSVVRRAARELTGADGATFVLRENGHCLYADEDAIAPLWKGRRFPMSTCISGWVMLHGEPAVIEDIYADARIPADAYRPTFVKSLVMVPIRKTKPVGAIGNYWAHRHCPRPEEVKILQALADSTSVAMEKVQLYADLERKVADRTARLQALNEELEAFSYSVSHDLRAPLRHIAGFAEMLQTAAHDLLPPECQRHLNIISDSARRMSVLIDQLLEFSRMSRAEMSPDRIDMNQLVEEARRELEADIGNRDVQWQIEPLPMVRGDRALLKQVWLNLLSNAVKYTRRRHQAVIRIEARTGEDEIEFLVQDNGAGFDMQWKDKLFGVFERLHHEEDFEGTGIGLANVRRIVARHGGRTWATGEVDRGATFYFTLPTPTEP
ncbi:MAG: ATP-binding protein [Verrucomicrobiota bacterium]